MTVADAPYAAAFNALAEIDDNANIRASFERLILPHAQIFFSSEYVDAEQKRAFRDLAKLKSTDSSPCYRGLLILVCTTFEYFSKQLIQNVVADYGASANAYTAVPKSALSANFAYTGIYFSRERDSYDEGSGRAIFEQLVKGLNTCTHDSDAVTLNPLVFVYSLGNCTPSQLERRYAELGLKEPFGDNLGANSGLRAHFGGGGARDVAKRARIKLEDLIGKRNDLVHSKTISETVTLNDLLDASGFVRALIGAMRDTLATA